MALAVEQNQNEERGQNVRLTTLGLAFVGALGLSTLCSMMGYIGWSMGLGLVGICCMVMFIFNLKTSQ